MTGLPVTLPVFCASGCGTDVSERALALPGRRLLCALCGAEEAMAILGDPKASARDCEMAESALQLYSVWRKLDLRKQGR